MITDGITQMLYVNQRRYHGAEYWASASGTNVSGSDREVVDLTG